MDVEGTSDIYVLGFFDIKDKQSTDTHFRSQNGVGSFNWRMLLPYQTPSINNTLSIQVYDADLFSSDDYICGAQLNIKDLMVVPKNLDLPFKFTKEYYKSLTQEEKKRIGSEIEFEDQDDPDGIKFWVQCYKDGKKGGRVKCSLEIVPEWKALLNPVGKGRKEPNVDPYLPPPFGRFEWSLNPFKLFRQLVGKKFRRKCCIYCCSAICVVYLCFAIPYIIYHLSGEIVNPFNY